MTWHRIDEETPQAPQVAQEPQDDHMHIGIPNVPSHISLPMDTAPDSAAHVSGLVHRVFTANPHLNVGSDRVHINIPGLTHEISLPANTPVETANEIAEHLYNSAGEGNIAEHYLTSPEFADLTLPERITEAARVITAAKDNPTIFHVLARRLAPAVRRFANNVRTAVQQAATPASSAPTQEGARIVGWARAGHYVDHPYLTAPTPEDWARAESAKGTANGF